MVFVDLGDRELGVLFVSIIWSCPTCPPGSLRADPAAPVWGPGLLSAQCGPHWAGPGPWAPALWSAVSSIMGMRLPLPCSHLGCEDPGDWRDSALTGSWVRCLTPVSLCVVSLTARMWGLREQGGS